jgi:hypothetical protein
MSAIQSFKNFGYRLFYGFMLRRGYELIELGTAILVAVGAFSQEACPARASFTAAA